MPYKNLTIAFDDCGHDGFGSQYLKKIAGWAFCWHEGSKRYRYVHTPFVKFDHLTDDFVPTLNHFVGIPDARHGKRIHTKFDIMRDVHREPNRYFHHGFLKAVKNHYFSTFKPKLKDDIVVHIRRNDLHLKVKRPRDVNGTAHKRMTDNDYYAGRLPLIMRDNPDSKIVIISDGTSEELESIFRSWSPSMIDAVEMRLNSDPCESFHSMVMANKLFLARSSFSFVAGLLNESEVYFQNGWSNCQTSRPLNHWKNWEEYAYIS